jgi:hypothetical protein
MMTVPVNGRFQPPGCTTRGGESPLGLGGQIQRGDA